MLRGREFIFFVHIFILRGLYVDETIILTQNDIYDIKKALTIFCDKCLFYSRLYYDVL